MRSFAYTQIRHFYFKGCYICTEINESDNYNIFIECFLKVHPCSNFFEELRYAVSRTTNRIDISRLELSSREFIQLVKAAKKVKEINIWECKISSASEFDFGPMEGCQIEEISIGYFDKVYDEWNEYEECLMKIFWGILNCKNLIGSLKDLKFSYTRGLKKEFIKIAKETLGKEYLKIIPSLKK